MNPNFLLLPQDRQLTIINAGFKVFAFNSYKKAPVAEIAKEADISKSLLFYHFKNKKDLYLYLWKVTIETTRKQLAKDKVMETSDLFEMMKRSLHGKCEVMRKYPYMAEFSIKAYYEQEPEIAELIQKDFARLAKDSQRKVLEIIDVSCFSKEMDIAYMYQEMIWAADGYLHMAYAGGIPDPDKVEMEFSRLIEFWKSVYRKKDIE